MVPTFVKCAATMLEEWRELVLSSKKEVDVFEEFCKLTVDAISHTAFGSNYAQGYHIFSMQAQQMVLAAESVSRLYIPGCR